MAVIQEIVSVERRVSKAGNVYYVTTALLESGDEVEGFGDEFEVGDKVQAFFDDRYNKAKMQKQKPLT